MDRNQRLKRLRKGKNRGKNVSEVFKLYHEDLSNKTILDVGCGHGSLTIDFAELFKEVHSIDKGERALNATRKRTENYKNVTVREDNALNITTTKKKYDIVHLSGVFEWLRAGNTKKTARQCHEQFLKNIKKNLKDQGILYSGTENLLFPYYWLRDPHNNKWPLLTLLPEKLNDALFKLIYNKKYIARIYSYPSLKKMYKKHYKEVDFYIPIPHYQYVYGFANINDRKNIIKECKKVQSKYKLDLMQKFTVSWIKNTARLGLIKLLTPGFITVAKK